MDDDSKAAYADSNTAMDEHNEWKIRLVEFTEIGGPDFSSRLTIEVSADARYWSIDFDMLDFENAVLLRVHEPVE